MIQQNSFKDIKEFALIMGWVCFFLICFTIVCSQIRYVDVTVQDHEAGYEVNGQYYSMELPLREDGEVLHWAYLSFYPSEHIRKEDVTFWLTTALWCVMLPTMCTHFVISNKSVEKHSRELQSWGIRIQGKYISHRTRRIKRSRQHVAKIDFNGVEITTKRHSQFIHDYSNCVAYVNPNNPKDYTILVSNEIIE